MTRKWLIDLRKSKQLTQEKVATIAYIDRGYYTQIETGVRNPSFNVAINIALALDFDPSLFFHDIHQSNTPKDIPSYFELMDKGQVLYLYNRFESYLDNVVSFLLTGIDKGVHMVIIDNPGNLIHLNQRLEADLIRFNEESKLHLLNEEDLHFNQAQGCFVRSILSLDSDLEDSSIRIWSHNNVDLDNDSLTERSNSPCDSNILNRNRILSVTAFNAFTTSASHYLKMMRNYPYLMTDLEIVYSPLYQPNNKSIIFPSLFLQDNMK